MKLTSVYHTNTCIVEYDVPVACAIAIAHSAIQTRTSYTYEKIENLQKWPSTLHFHATFGCCYLSLVASKVCFPMIMIKYTMYLNAAECGYSNRNVSKQKKKKKETKWHRIAGIAFDRRFVFISINWSSGSPESHIFIIPFIVVDLVHTQLAGWSNFFFSFRIFNLFRLL